MLRIALACTVLACATSRPASVDVVQRQLEAFNAQNLDAFAATYADDVLITRGPEKKPFVQGKQELRDVYGKMFAKYPNCRARLAERKTEGEKVGSTTRSSRAAARSARIRGTSGSSATWWRPARSRPSSCPEASHSG